MLVAQGHLAIARGQERVGQAPCADLRHEAVNLDLSRRGVLPAFKIGKHWRYRRADLEEWMVRQRDVAQRRRPVLAPAVVDIVARSPHQATP